MGEGLQRNGTLRYASVTDLNTAQSEKDAALQKYVSDVSNYWTSYYKLRQYALYDFMSGTGKSRILAGKLV